LSRELADVWSSAAKGSACGDLSESWTIDVGGAVGKSRLCELRVIEDVKEIQAQFQD
jgi:hypothetical protein